MVQRETRDHFTEIADEHHRSLTDSVAAAQKAAATYAVERDLRMKEIRTQLKTVDALHQAATQLQGSAADARHPAPEKRPAAPEQQQASQATAVRAG